MLLASMESPEAQSFVTSCDVIQSYISLLSYSLFRLLINIIYIVTIIIKIIIIIFLKHY